MKSLLMWILVLWAPGAYGADLEWPKTTPIDKADPYWQLNNNLSVNGVPYHKVEVSPGKWEWRVNQESQQRLRNFENRKRELFEALGRRVLSTKEYEEAWSYGEELNIEPMVSYRKDQKLRELYDAFYSQARLRQLQKEKRRP